jgi:hypothetical protein
MASWPPAAVTIRVRICTDVSSALFVALRSKPEMVLTCAAPPWRPAIGISLLTV